MATDLERQLAELGATWNDTLSHVGMDEILHRSERSSSAAAEVGVEQHERSGTTNIADRRSRWLLTVAASLILVLVGSLIVIRGGNESPEPVDQPTPSTDVSSTTSPLTTTTVGDAAATTLPVAATTLPPGLPSAPEPSFTATGGMATDCFHCPALLLDDGRVFVASYGVIQTFDPTTETFSTLGRIEIDVGDGALLPDGQVILTGSNGGIAIVDPETGSVRTLRTQNEQHQIPDPMDYTIQIPVVLVDGRVLVFSQADVSEIDLATGALSSRTTMPMPLRDTMIVVPLDDGNVLVTGLSLNSDNSFAATYDTDTGVFVSVDAPSSPMNAPSAIRLLDGRVLLTGDSRDAEIFDPATGTFSRTGSMSNGNWTQGRPSAILPDGRVLVVKTTNGVTTVATTSIFDPATGIFTEGPPTLRPRLGATAVTLRDGRVLLLGSYRGNAEGIPGDGPSSAEIFSIAPPLE